MLPSSRAQILERLAEDDLVLDVGGWAKPLSRADWVIDLMPYAERGMYGEPDPDPERFTQATWVQRDICDREPWPFAADQFDFVVCSHTLEDIRDPIWVCREMMRVGRAGYIEVPSRLEEQTFGVEGPWAGWGHHHWMIDVTDRGLDFVFKFHVIHGRPSDLFPRSFWEGLSPEEKVETLWWEDAFAVRERIFMDAAEARAYLDDLVSRHFEAPSPTLARRLRLAAGRALLGHGAR